MIPDNIPPPPPGWAIVPADDPRLNCLPCDPILYLDGAWVLSLYKKGERLSVKDKATNIYALPIEPAAKPSPASSVEAAQAEAERLVVSGVLQGSGTVGFNDMQTGKSCIVSIPTPGLDPKGEAGKAKAPLYLLPPEAMRQAAWAHSLGARKYGPANWRSNKVKASTYISAMMRHIAAYLDGEDHDAETSAHAGQPVSHLANVIASANILLDAKKNGTLEDDRPPRRPELSPLCPD